MLRQNSRSVRSCVPVGALILAGALVTADVAAQQGAAPAPTKKPTTAKPASGMTNADVTKMVAVGLSEPIVISAIRSAKVRNFDTSAAGLIALKTAGVSDAIIAVVLNPDAAVDAPTAGPTAAPVSAVPAAPAAPPAAAVNENGLPAVVTSEPGLYYVGEPGIVRVEAKTPYQTRTGSTLASRLTLGIKPARINAMLMGLRSDLQVSTTPSFYMHLGQVLGQSESIGEYYLVKFTVKESQGRREIEIGSANFTKFQAGFPEKDLFMLESTRIQKDIYRLTPKSALPTGEFGILQLPQGSAPAPMPKKIFDFGVR